MRSQFRNMFEFDDLEFNVGTQECMTEFFLDGPDLDFDIGTQECMTESDIKQLQLFLDGPDIVEKRFYRQYFSKPIENCNLNNENLTLIPSSRAFRFCNVIKEILSQKENPDFDYVRDEIFELKTKNCFADRISRKNLKMLFHNFEHKEVLAYISQSIIIGEYAHDFINICMRNLTQRSCIFTRNFKDSLYYGNYYNKSTEIVGFVNKEKESLSFLNLI